jgi:plasmid maintenance system killer protein
MLKAMRKHAKFFYVLFFIVIISFIFWGVGNVDKSTAVPVAEVGKEKISVEEYWMTYDRTRQFYRDLLKENFTEEMEKKLNLKQKVLDNLIEERVLLITARTIGMTVSDDELQDAIMNDPTFVREGKFSKEIYLRTLQLNRITPEGYETLKRRDLLSDKMRRFIVESVDITDVDIPQQAGTEQMKESLKQNMLQDMRHKAFKSYIEGMKKQMSIKINQQLIG